MNKGSSDAQAQQEQAPPPPKTPNYVQQAPQQAPQQPPEAHLALKPTVHTAGELSSPVCAGSQRSGKASTAESNGGAETDHDSVDEIHAIEAQCASEKASTAESNGGAETDRTSHESVDEKVFLRHGVYSNFADLSNALERTSHKDLAYRPALEIAQAYLMLAGLNRSASPTPSSNHGSASELEAATLSPTDVSEYLACAGAVVKQVLNTVQMLLCDQLSLPRGALITRDEMLDAALCLRNGMHDVINKWNAAIHLCEWERSIPGRGSTDEEKKTAVVWKPTPSNGAATCADDDEEVDAEHAKAPAGPVPAAVQVVFDALQRGSTSGKSSDAGVAHRSPPLLRPEPAEPPSIAQILPNGLSQQGLLESCRTQVQTLNREQFRWNIGDELPELFKVEHWSCPVFLSPKADAAAKKVTAALVKIQSLTAAPPAEDYPEELSAAMRKFLDKMYQDLHESKVMRETEKLVADVNCAKETYCDALLQALRHPMTLAGLASATYVDSMAPGRLVSEADKRASFKHILSHASGCCPIRAAISATLTAGTRLSHAECIHQQRAVNEGGKVLEQKAHIIPLAAASCPLTPMLLYKVDGSNPPKCGQELLEYLALPHNTFYLSSCFKLFFDRGALVFVKIGPPECQFYRVTTTEKAEAAVIDFGADSQMRGLFEHMGPADMVPLSCIDGLVVDLGRAAKIISDGVMLEIPRVSHRYLDLHARTHHPPHREAPLISHPYSLTVAKVKTSLVHRCHAASDKATIEKWLDTLAIDNWTCPTSCPRICVAHSNHTLTDESLEMLEERHDDASDDSTIEERNEDV